MGVINLRFFALCAILALSAGLMLYVSAGDSATMDELAHIPAGYSYAKFLDYRLNPEHPPLLKALSGLFLIGMDLNFPTEHESWANDVNGQWNAGTEFLYKSSNDTDTVIFLARMAPVLITLVLICVIYAWAKELLGSSWALLPAFLFGLSPIVLAHGHYVTTDVAAALGVFLALWSLTSYFLKKTRKFLWLAGLSFGFAQLMKFSNVLLFPFFLILALIFYLLETEKEKTFFQTKHVWKKLFAHIGKIIGIFLIGFIVIYSVYFVFTLNYPDEKQINDTSHILSSFSPKWLTSFNLRLAEYKISQPIAQYFLGVLMVMQRSTGGNTAYFLGDVSSEGWWHYFPVVFLLKEPIPVIMLYAIALFFALKSFFKNKEAGPIKKRLKNYISINFPEFSMAVFVIFYLTYSIQSPLNIGIRHLLPILPFLYILTAREMKMWCGEKRGLDIASLLSKKIRKERQITPLLNENAAKRPTILARVTIILLCVWFLGEIIFASPYFLSYYNEFGSGTYGGYKFATDSNYDWGQDLKRLSKWVEEKNFKNADQTIVAVDYFGGGNVEKISASKFIKPWDSSKGDPGIEGIRWIAISVNTLSQAFAQPTKGFERKQENSYEWLKSLKGESDLLGKIPLPDERAGTSIFIYHL